MGSPPILFGHLKYGSTFIFSRIWCTGSLNIMLATWAIGSPVCPVKSLRSRLLLYLSDLKSIRSEGATFAFPYCWSSSTRLCLSIWSMSWCMHCASFFVKDFLNSCLVGRPTLNVLIATSSKSPSISLNVSQYLFE